MNDYEESWPSANKNLCLHFLNIREVGPVTSQCFEKFRNESHVDTVSKAGALNKRNKGLTLA